MVALQNCNACYLCWTPVKITKGTLRPPWRRRFRTWRFESFKEGKNPDAIGSMYSMFIYLHLVDFYGKCRYIYHSHESYANVYSDVSYLHKFDNLQEVLPSRRLTFVAMMSLKRRTQHSWMGWAQLGGGFKDFCISTPTWGNDPIWLYKYIHIIFFRWVETTN